MSRVGQSSVYRRSLIRNQYYHRPPPSSPFSTAVQIFRPAKTWNDTRSLAILDRVLVPFRNRPSGESILRYLFAETSNSIHPSRFEYQGGNIKKDGIELGDEGHKSLLSLIYRCQRGGKGHFFRYKNSHTEDGNLF